MDKPVNLKEAKELVQIYRSITLEDLTKRWNDYMNTTENTDEDGDVQIDADVIGEILGTGFNETDSCILCKAVTSTNYRKVFTNCVGCLYQVRPGYESYACCNIPENGETFEKMADSTNPEKLYSAINSRADYIEQLISKWENGEFDHINHK